MEIAALQRINELAKLAKERPLTEAELAERDQLRKEYLAEFRAGLQAQLDNTYVVDDKGNKRKLVRKK